MTEIRIIDSVCFGGWHLNFNLQLMHILCEISDNVFYYGAQDFGENYANLKIKRIYVIRGNSRIARVMRLLVSFINDVWQLLISNSSQIIIYSFDSCISLNAINIISKILNRRVILIRHGSMEMLKSDLTERGVIYNFESSLIKKFFLNKKTRIAKNLYFFVLGDILLQNLSKVLDAKIFPHFRSFEQPYLFDGKNFNKKINLNSNLLLGTVGVFNENKGGRVLLKLMSILSHKGVNNINYSITGRIDFDLSVLNEYNIDLPSNSGRSMISNEERNARIDRLDFILYFYSFDTYKFTASAAIFDAINRRRPIIALRNDYFDYIFKKYGPFGYLVDSVEEMASLIATIVKGNEIYYDFDFDSIHTKLSLDYRVAEFRNLLQECKFLGI